MTDHVQVVLDAACSVFSLEGVELREVAPRSRPDICWARQLAMYWLTEKSLMSGPQIARILGLKNHTTVIYARRATVKRLADNADFATAVFDAEVQYGESMKRKYIPTTRPCSTTFHFPVQFA